MPMCWAPCCRWEAAGDERAQTSRFSRGARQAALAYGRASARVVTARLPTSALPVWGPTKSSSTAVILMWPPAAACSCTGHDCPRNTGGVYNTQLSDHVELCLCMSGDWEAAASTMRPASRSTAAVVIRPLVSTLA
ncbi:hypothetical protein TREES_T100001643 [Tupaia chinensis]|uniref:Uncharacterized protein n=1 Tax=Tupaia chinensis TaxID=246437 RepID=L9KKB8_TUPCH|nr:hypothetical protein TREES_T100001643 [Tupaia chinensis]